MARNNGQLSIENAHIWACNFTGNAGRYNKEGERSFCLTIDDEDVALRLREDGWNIKRSKPREDDPDYEPSYYMNVAVNYRSARPPRVILKRGSKLTVLDEENIGTLDSAMKKNVAVVINPYTWRRDDGSIGGIKGYLQSMLVEVEEDLVDKLLADMESPED